MTTSTSDLRALARFRYAMRKFLHAGEEAAREEGLTAQHHHLLLGVAGFTDKGWATIGELAEFMQVRHHSMVGLVDRAEELGLVRRQTSSDDRRAVRVFLTAEGARKLRALEDLHHRELLRMRRGFNLAFLEREVGVQRKPSPRGVKVRRRP
jgi:DNA-binding MarR family transcriptional regulator